MKSLYIESNEKGFTLVELMIVIAIISILASVALPLYAASREKASDAAAKLELKNAMKFIDLYSIDNGFPETLDDLLAGGFNQSKNVVFTKYSIGTFGDGQPTVHIHVKHAGSSNSWHVNFPKEGSEISIR